MIYETNPVINFLLSILLFPLLFQAGLLEFAWGSAMDPASLLILKRVFLLLPALVFIGACWITIASLLTVIFRHNRQPFIVALIMTWWDFGKSVFRFWGGIFRFLFVLIMAILGTLRILISIVWSVILDLILLPFRFLGHVIKQVLGSTVPWIAVTLTLFWALIEAVIFTYVMTPVFVDVFSYLGITEGMIRIPLFIFLLFVVLASYAVLSTTVETVKKKKITTALGIAAIELIVIFVEVMFLYREFVDSLVPWFAQYSENFELGIFWTILIAFFVWFGIRSLSWFLFAAHGTPVIMDVIQGRPIKPSSPSEPIEKMRLVPGTQEMFQSLQTHYSWIQQKGEGLIAACMLPPLQVVAAAINFVVLLLISEHVFELPFRSLSDIRPSSELMGSDKKTRRPPVQEKPFNQD